VQSSKVEEKKKGKQHYAYLRSFGRQEEFLICDDFFLWQVILLFVMSKTNLHKLLHHKHACDGHITYTCVLW